MFFLSRCILQLIIIGMMYIRIFVWILMIEQKREIENITAVLFLLCMIEDIVL